MRMTLAMQEVLAALLVEPDRERYGRELVRGSRLESGTLYPILARLESEGWVTRRWEDVEPGMEGRPRRRYYRLTPAGREAATAAMAEIDRRMSAWKVRA